MALGFYVSNDKPLQTSEASRIAEWRTNVSKKELIAATTPEDAVRSSSPISSRHNSWILGLTSLFFILLQSACAAVMALSGLRLLIGIGSLAAATAGADFLAAIHGKAIRIPMEILAIAGSAVNLYVIWRIRSLRARPSSQWRVGPVMPSKKRAESIQIALGVLTLALVIVEWAIHIYLHGSI